MIPIVGIFNQQVPPETVPTPYAFWPMQEGSGTTLTDTIAARVANINSATWSVAGGRNGTNALTFAVGQWATIADPWYLDPFSVSAWIYPTNSVGSFKSILSIRNDVTGSNVASASDFELYLSTTNTLWFKRWSTSSTETLFVSGATQVPPNTWSHVAGSSGGDGQTGYVYLNGVIDGSATQGALTLNGAGAFQFGGRTANSDARYYLGRMQEVRVYNSRLSEADMTSVYNAATP